MNGNVYIFDFGDKIKAGYSTNVAKRQRTIELSSGVKARNVYSVGGSRTEEKLLHSHLDNRLEGEFFATSFETAKAVLDRIVAGEITARRGGKVSKAQQKAVAKYEAKVYDKTLIRMPKGQLDAIKAAAAGMSANAYILEAIREKMSRDGAESDGPSGAAQKPVDGVSGVGGVRVPSDAEKPVESE